MALICINPNFREVNDVNTNAAIFGYRISKIYEGIKTVRSRTVEKVAKWRTFRKAGCAAGFPNLFGKKAGILRQRQTTTFS